MNHSNPTAERFQGWFRSKRDEILAASRQAMDHPGLIGSHRESILRRFLAELLPGRLSVDRGIVYSPNHRSGECDIVIWDQSNFPRLTMFDHSSFLIESVSLVIEVKSNYSLGALRECFENSLRLRRMSIGSHASPELLADWRIESLEERVAALEAGLILTDTMIVHPRVAYGVIFIAGGESIAPSDVVPLSGEVGGFDGILRASWPS